MDSDLEFISLTKSLVITGRSPAWLMRQAMLGNVRTRIEPGIPTRYCRVDVEALAKKQAPKPAA